MTALFQRNARWFNKKKAPAVTDDSVEGSEEPVGHVLIKRDTLIKAICKRGRSEAVEHYRVLSLFTKYYGKWFVGQVENFPWNNDPLAVKNSRVLVRMTEKRGGSNKEEQLEVVGAYGPKQIFLIKNYSEIMVVDID